MVKETKGVPKLNRPVSERFVRASYRGPNRKSEGSFVLHFESLNKLADFVYENCAKCNKRGTILYRCKPSLLSKKEQKLLIDKVIYRMMKES